MSLVLVNGLLFETENFVLGQASPDPELGATLVTLGVGREVVRVFSQASLEELKTAIDTDQWGPTDGVNVVVPGSLLREVAESHPELFQFLEEFGAEGGFVVGAHIARLSVPDVDARRKLIAQAVADARLELLTCASCGNPSADAPAEEPVVDAPAEEPVVDAPAEEPAVDGPAEEPVVDAPAEEPVVDAPAEEPVGLHLPRHEPDRR